MTRISRSAWPTARGNQPSRTAGFSLLELVIVLVIVLLLSSMYWGTTSRSNQVRQQKNCQKNLQKIYIALEIFAADHQENYPVVPGARTPGEALDGLVPRYTADTGVFVCPGGKGPILPAGESIAKRKISYAYYMGRRRPAVADVLMSDQQVDALAKSARQLAFSAAGEAPGNNHGRFGGNFLFGDGHTELTPARVPFPLVLSPGVVLLNP